MVGNFAGKAAETTFLQQLNSVKLTAKEKRLSEYIIEHSQEIILMSISEAAEACGVSEATLVRFSKKLGYKGFQALKIHMAREMTERQERLISNIQEGDSTVDIARKVFASYQETLDTTLNVVQPELIDAAAECIKSAKRIFFFAAGGSQIVASDAANKFMRIGILSYCYADANSQRMNASMMTSEDAAIAVSHSGATNSTLECLALAKERGARTIAVTNFSRSPILKYSDICLYTSSNETRYLFESQASRIAQLTILDLLINVIFMSDYKLYSQNFNETRTSLDGTKI